MCRGALLPGYPVTWVTSRRAVREMTLSNPVGPRRGSLPDGARAIESLSWVVPAPNLRPVRLEALAQ